MKRILSLFVVGVMFLALLLNTSCSTAKLVNNSFIKEGYTMAILTPQQQVEIAPVMNAFPAFHQNAMGYIKQGDTVTFVYETDAAVWNSYCASLETAGFSNLGKGLIKADKNTGITYNISGKFVTVDKLSYLLVAFKTSRF